MNTNLPQILQLQQEISHLRHQLSAKESALVDLQKTLAPPSNQLTNSEIARYSRQIILPNFGVKGQLSLKAAAVLIVGVGGLGVFSEIFFLTPHLNL